MAHKEPDPKHVIIAEVPPNTPVRGATLRPPRPLTIGRRHSDRWLAYSIALFFVVASVFIVGQAFRTEQLLRIVEQHEQECPAVTPRR